jgi:hypothetical protein
VPDSRDQHQDEKHDAQGEQRHRHALEERRRHGEQQCGSGEADQREQQLTLEVIERLPRVLTGDRHRSRGHHDEPEQRDRRDERERHRVEVHRRAARTAALESEEGGAAHAASSCTASVNTAPRCA